MSTYPKATYLLMYILALQVGNRRFTCSPHTMHALKVWPSSATVAAGAGLRDVENFAMNTILDLQEACHGTVWKWQRLAA